MADPAKRITRQDIEDRLRELTGGIEETASEARASLVGVAGGAAVALILLAYLLGRRSGHRRSAVVEIRRA